MTAIIIIITLIITLILFSLVKNKIEDNRYRKTQRIINQAHEKIGYPKIDRETQMKMVINEDTSPITNLIPGINYIYRPTNLLDKYITISKSDFKEYLQLNFHVLDKYNLKNAPNPKQDGVWISGDKIIDQERGMIHRTWNNVSKKEISDIYGDLMWSWMNLK